MTTLQVVNRTSDIEIFQCTVILNTYDVCLGISFCVLDCTMKISYGQNLLGQKNCWENRQYFEPYFSVINLKKKRPTTKVVFYFCTMHTFVYSVLKKLHLKVYLYLLVLRKRSKPTIHIECTYIDYKQIHLISYVLCIYNFFIHVGYVISIFLVSQYMFVWLCTFISWLSFSLKIYIPMKILKVEECLS